MTVVFLLFFSSETKRFFILLNECKFELFEWKMLRVLFSPPMPFFFLFFLDEAGGLNKSAMLFLVGDCNTNRKKEET